jgi:hypothetical protein
MDIMLLRPEGKLNATATDPPPTWNAFVESLIEGRRATCEVLRDIKETYNSLGQRRDIDVWNDVTQGSKLLRFLTPIPEKIKGLEKKTTPVDWKHLDSWINNVEKSTREELNNTYRLLSLLGIDPLRITTAKNVGTVLEMIKSTPLAQWQGFMLGPHWMSCVKESDRLDRNNPDDLLGISVDLFSPKVLLPAAEVMHRWQSLKKMADDEALVSFEKIWTGLTISARIRLLKEKYPQLPSHPHSDLYAWVQDSKLEKQLFMAPLLNFEDLSQDNVLPRLLKARAALHPTFFRSIDSSSVHWGIWCGALKQLKVKGRMSFTPETGEGAKSYGISLQPRIESECWSIPGFNEVRPSTGLYQLKAQCYTYDVLVSFAQSLLEPHRPGMRVLANEDGTTGAGKTGVFSEGLSEVPDIPDQHVGDDAYFGVSDVDLVDKGDESLTLLARCARNNYGRSPNIIDLEYVGDLLRSSLDEALDDLSQQRDSPDSWAMRAASSSGSASNLLRVIFSRIDTFHTLCLHSDAVLKHDWRKAQDGPTAPSEHREAFRQIVSLHVALKCTLNEILCQVKDIKWSPDKDCSIIFSRLFNLLKANEPSLRIMGIHAVMRMIDRELEKVDAQVTIPFAVMRILNDLSVLAVCLEETAKHYNFASDCSSYASMVKGLVAEWEARQRPFMSVIDDTLRELGESKVKKLDALVRKTGDPLPSRHNAFWTAVDMHMDNSSQSSEARLVVDTIQQTPIALINSKLLPVSYLPHSADEPTQTKIRRGRRRGKTKAQSLTTLPLTAQNSPSPSPPSVVIRPTKNITFWVAFLAPSSEDSSDLFWLDFCNAMRGIGFKIFRQGGSGRQFKGELGMIVFHEPHGHKVTHKIACIQWRSRIFKRFKVVLE